MVKLQVIIRYNFFLSQRRRSKAYHNHAEPQAKPYGALWSAEPKANPYSGKATGRKLVAVEKLAGVTMTPASELPHSEAFLHVAATRARLALSADARR